MLESLPRRHLLVLLAAGLFAASALAPLASAGVLADAQEAAAQKEAEAEEFAQDPSSGAPSTGTPADEYVAEVVPGGDDEAGEAEQESEPEEASQEEDASEGEDASSSDEGSDDGESGEEPGSFLNPGATIETVVTVAGFAAGTVFGLLPEDPVAFLNEQVEPIQEAADEVLVPDMYEAEEPEPASATVTAVETDVSPQLLAAGAGAAAAAALLAFWLAGSSGSLGASAATASGGSQLRRLLPFASPLFTRFEKDTVLGHPKRENLYALILQDPGVSLQSLCDATGLSRTAVTHHLRLLEMQHLIVSKRLGRSRHYYENGGRFGRDQKEAYAVLHNARSKEVARYVRDNPGAIQKALCEALGIQPSIAHWHLRRLQQAQLVEAIRTGRTVAYFPNTGLKGMDTPVVPVEFTQAAPEPTPAVAVPMLRALPA